MIGVLKYRVLLVALAFVLCTTSPALWQKGLAATPGNNSGIKISPLRSYPTQNPGDTSVGKIDITNLSDTPQLITLSTEEFKTINENYDYKFGTGDDVSWIRYPDNQINLKAHDTRTVAFSLAVPNDAKPGGHYLAMIATSETTKSTTDVNIVKRIASVVYLEVSGDITRKTDLVSFDSPWLITKNKIDVDVRITNEGNTHDRSRVGVTYKMWPFGKQTDEKIIEGLTLPSTIRKLSGELSLPNIPGIYQVNSTFSPPQGGTFHRTKIIIFIPYWTIIAIALVIMAIAWRIMRLKTRKTKSNN